jgi:hypothetical protein
MIDTFDTDGYIAIRTTPIDPEISDLDLLSGRTCSKIGDRFLGRAATHRHILAEKLSGKLDLSGGL